MSHTRIESAYERDGAVAILSLSGPDRLNAVGWESFSQFEAALSSIAGHAGIRVICLFGAGDKAFCAGADLDDIAKMDAAQFRQFAGHTARIVATLSSLPQIVIAGVNGIAYGAGCAIAMASDFVLAVPSARFAQPEIDVGIVGGTALLPRRVASRAVANEMLLLGRSIDAQEALRQGLVNRVVSSGALRSEVLAWADSLLAKPAEALSLAKQALVRGRALADESEAFELQQDLAAQSLSFESSRDAIAKFGARRRGPRH